MAYLCTIIHPPVCRYSPLVLARGWVSLILRGPGGSTYIAPGVLFWITTVESCDLVMILLNPEKSEKMVST